MANMTTIRQTMRKARRQGATLRSIGQHYGITAGAVGRILAGAYPDAANARRLGIPEKCTVCKRNMPRKKPRATRRVDDFFLDWMMR